MPITLLLLYCCCRTAVDGPLLLGCRSIRPHPRLAGSSQIIITIRTWEHDGTLESWQVAVVGAREFSLYCWFSCCCCGVGAAALLLCWLVGGSTTSRFRFRVKDRPGYAATSHISTSRTSGDRRWIEALGVAGRCVSPSDSFTLFFLVLGGWRASGDNNKQ